jgi:hypothetical protein
MDQPGGVGQKSTATLGGCCRQGLIPRHNASWAVAIPTRPTMHTYLEFLIVSLAFRARLFCLQAGHAPGTLIQQKHNKVCLFTALQQPCSHAWSALCGRRLPPQQQVQLHSTPLPAAAVQPPQQQRLQPTRRHQDGTSCLISSST